MITGGHIAASYLLAYSAQSLGISLTNQEIIGIILAGNIVDLDLLTGFLNGKTGEAHHQNITHTPVGVLIIWVIINIVFHPATGVSVLLLISMIIHLTLDETGYWAYRLKIIKNQINPQINWLYPLTPFPKVKLIISTQKALITYFVKAWPIVVIEGIIICVAVAVLIFSSLN